MQQGCSPHTRGWTAREVLYSRGWRGVPRIRGDGPKKPSPPVARAQSVPRIRGDGPLMSPAKSPPSWCSPHTRGWTVQVRKELRPEERVPRIRGDGPVGESMYSSAVMVFPAYAGMDRYCAGSICYQQSCSPHTRGWTVCDLWWPLVWWSVPRIRGDGPLSDDDFEQFLACSPHTRGWTEQSRRWEAIRIACSPHTRGWTERWDNLGQLEVRVPRIRGDGPSS